jgi:hypothetical protein
MGQRNTLVIYIIPLKSIPIDGDTAVTADSIVYTYANKNDEFSLVKCSSYDAEALFCIEDTLCVMTKNWKREATNFYKIPATAGNYCVSSFKTLYLNALVTGADISPDGSKLALISYADYIPVVFMLNRIIGFNFDTRKIVRYSLLFKPGVQSEGITFRDNRSVYVSSELNKVRSNSLYLLKF